jgi:hypothetical protein
LPKWRLRPPTRVDIALVITKQEQPTPAINRWTMDLMKDAKADAVVERTGTGLV